MGDGFVGSFLLPRPGKVGEALLKSVGVGLVRGRESGLDLLMESISSNEEDLRDSKAEVANG
jgi:hypothetical protein